MGGIMLLRIETSTPPRSGDKLRKISVRHRSGASDIHEFPPRQVPPGYANSVPQTGAAERLRSTQEKKFEQKNSMHFWFTAKEIANVHAGCQHMVAAGSLPRIWYFEFSTIAIPCFIYRCYLGVFFLCRTTLVHVDAATQQSPVSCQGRYPDGEAVSLPKRSSSAAIQAVGEEKDW